MTKRQRVRRAFVGRARSGAARGLVAVASAAVLASAAPGRAEEGAPPPPSGDTGRRGDLLDRGRRQDAFTFGIPPKALPEALADFTEATGIRVLAREEDLGGLRSHAAVGTFTPHEALARMLEGTGTGWRFVRADAVEVEPRSAAPVRVAAAGDATADAEDEEGAAAEPAAGEDDTAAGDAGAEEPSAGEPAATAPAAGSPIVLDPLTVEAERSRYLVEQPSSPKLPESLRDTPQSVTAVPRELVEDQNATSLRDTLRNVPGISMNAGEGGNQGENLTVRGFNARNDIFLDGMRDFGSYPRDPFNLEAVEVLKGPSSLLFGRGSTGGAVNQVSKTPRRQPWVSGILTGGTDETKRGTIDLNQPLAALGESAAFRLNAMGHDAEVAGRDGAKIRRFGVAPSLAIGLGTPTRFTLSYLHQSSDDVPDYGIPYLFDRPAPVRRRNFYGFENANFFKTSADVATARVEHDLSEAVTVRDQIRWASYSRDGRISEARVPTDVLEGTPLESIEVDRNQIAIDSRETFLQNQLDLVGRFATGPVDHVLVGGVEAGRETSDPTRFDWEDVPTTSLLRPEVHETFAGVESVRSRTDTTAKTVGVYLLDSFEPIDSVQIIGGVRWDRFDAEVDQSVDPATSLDRVDDEVTYRAAIAYRPLENGNVYFAWGTSFNPSAEQLSLQAANADLDPETNETFELGTKWDLFDERLSVAAALFRIEKNDAREPDPTNPLLNVLSGKHRVDGFEISAVGEPLPGLQVFSGYSYLDGEIVESGRPDQEGDRLPHTPEHTLAFWSTYRLPWSVEVGGGVRYLTERIPSTTPDVATGRIKKVPGYWALDAMAGYDWTPNLGFQVNVLNLTDKYYFDQLHPGHIVPGAGRTALFSTHFRF